MNFLRIMVITIYAPKVFDNELYNINKGFGRKVTGSAKFFEILFVPEEAK